MSASAASNDSSVPAAAGSGTDQCHVDRRRSSWARSQTVMTTCSSCGRWYLGRASDRSRPARAAARIAPGWTSSTGWVPPELAGCPSSRRHSAAAIWDRAELCVQTNTTGASATVGCVGDRGAASMERAASMGSAVMRRRYRRRRSPADVERRTIPAASRVWRWNASNGAATPSREASSDGERSLNANSSTIASRVGSASAAWWAARRSSSDRSTR